MPTGVRPISIGSVDRESLRVAGLGRAKRVVALLDDDAANLRLCQLAHTAFRIPHVVARVKDSANVEAYAAVGAVPVTHLNAEITVLENLASNPSVFTLLSGSNGDQEIIELAVTNPACDGTPMHTLKLPGAALIMVIHRNGSFVVPRGDTRLILNDTITVLASPAEADRVRMIFT